MRIYMKQSDDFISFCIFWGSIYTDVFSLHPPTTRDMLYTISGKNKIFHLKISKDYEMWHKLKKKQLKSTRDEVNRWKQEILDVKPNDSLVGINRFSQKWY